MGHRPPAPPATAPWKRRGVRGRAPLREYRAVIAGISDRLLAQRLRELEAGGLIERYVIPSTPVQARHELAPDGEALVAALQPLGRGMRRPRRLR
ncbi:winged helix-turn-helix transcriptional regulator [Actinacidiphila sp. bgisy167]|uniref:winged helix-turn-helix transcriptional regulator n=1 Tax=Actinacidiphila sp. bgisy167 TaxID=3413797 RepID=UPI003D70611C